MLFARVFKRASLGGNCLSIRNAVPLSFANWVIILSICFPIPVTRRAVPGLYLFRTADQLSRDEFPKSDLVAFDIEILELF